MSEMLTTAQVAALLNLSERQVRTLAQRRGVGTLLTPRQRVYTHADVALLRERPRQGWNLRTGARGAGSEP